MIVLILILLSFQCFGLEVLVTEYKNAEKGSAMSAEKSNRPAYRLPTLKDRHVLKALLNKDEWVYVSDMLFLGGKQQTLLINTKTGRIKIALVETRGNVILVK